MDRDPIYDRKKKVTPKLMALPGVTFVGVGRGEKSHLAVHIGMNRKDKKTEKEIRAICKDIPILIFVTGNVRSR